VTAPRLIEIPMFNHEESLDVAALFEQHAIHYRKNVVHLGATSMGGRHAYTFWVREDQAGAALALLMKLFGLREEAGAVSGECPACGTQVEDKRKCPSCGLNLSGDHSGVTGAHPFVLWLRDNDLL